LRTATWLYEIDRAAKESLQQLFEIKIGVARERLRVFAIEFD
jgi:hypothetical protein